MIEESLWKVLAFLLVVVLIFVGPTVTAYDRMDAITYNVVASEVTRFCDTVRDLGYVDERALTTLMDSLSATGVSYNVTLEHHEKTYIPVYSSGSFKDRYEIVYESHYNDEIESALSAGIDYIMDVGDMFYIHVENRSATKSQTIRQLFLGVSQKYPVIVVRNGGMIRHESD